MPDIQRDQVFISYSHKDSKLFGEFKTMLAPLEAAGRVEVWDDERIAVGADWRQEIARAIDRARVAVLLVTKDFLASPFIAQSELPPLLLAAGRDELTIMTVHLLPSMWEQTALAPLQGANKPNAPIGALPRARRDAAFKAVCDKLLAILASPPNAPAAPGAASASATLGLSGALSGSSAGAGSAAAQPGLASAQAFAGLVVPSNPRLDAERRPRAEFDTLFEVIDESEDPLPALYGVEPAQAAELGSDYVDAREDCAQLRVMLVQALLAAGARLLLHGRAGIGKTREVAELARDWGSRGWKTCVARGGQADAAMGELVGLPTRLADARLLVIIDNLHLRGAAEQDEAHPYLDRLEACLASLARLVPDELRVLAITRSEPQHLKRLGLDPALPRWRGFGLFAVPEFRPDGLAQLLGLLAHRAGLAVQPAQALTLVLDSDRKPRTLVINVRRIARLGAALDAAHWLPREGDSWHESIAAARARQPALGSVFQALHLLAAAELLPRRSSVRALAARLAGVAGNAAAAVDALIDGGLAGLRGDVLRLFSDEVAALGLRGCGVEAPALAEGWPQLIAALTEPAPQPGWGDDLNALAYALVRAARPDDAERVASLAIDQADGLEPRRARAAAHFVARRYRQCLVDLDAALGAAPDSIDALRMRAFVRNLLGEHAGVVADIDGWLRIAPGDREALVMRAVGLFPLGRLQEAEADLDAAIEAGTTEAMAWFLRAVVRWQRSDFAGAESDFGVALDAAFDLDLAQRRIAALSQGDAAQVMDTLRDAAARAQAEPRPPEAEAPLTPGRALIHGMRGMARMRLERWADAEQDLDRAIEGGFGAAFAAMKSGIDACALPGVQYASAALAAAEQAQMADESSMKLLRGLVRVEQQKDEAALEDLDAALARGIGGSAARFARALALARLGRLAAARADIDNCLAAGDDNALVRSLRGAVAFDLGELDQAASDIESAIALGRDDAWVHQLSAVANHRLGRLDTAAAAAEKLLVCAPEAPLSWFLRGSIRYDQQQFDGALSDLDQAIARGDTLPGARALRGLLHFRAGRFEPAEIDLALAAERGMRDGNVMYGLGAVKLARDAFAEAEADCNAAIAAGRDDEWVYFVRGRARYRLDREAEAEADYDAALARGMDSGELHYWRGEARAWQGKHAQALADFDLAAERGEGQNAQLLISRARTLLRLQESTRARADLDAAIVLGRDDATLRTLRAEASFRLGELDTARVDLEHALAFEPKRPGTLRWAAELALIEARFGDALAHLDLLLAEWPPTADALSARGMAHYALGNIERARSDFAAGLELTPDDVTLRCRLALALMRQGKLGDAEQALQTARALDAQQTELLGSAAVLELARGRLAEAQAQFAALSGADWTCWRALAGLLAGDAASALALYQQGLPQESAGDRALTRAEFEHWWALSSRHTTDGAPPELEQIKALLAA